MYWTVASGVFDARQAKRLFPLLTGAAIAGTFVGTLGAGPATAIGGRRDARGARGSRCWSWPRPHRAAAAPGRPDRPAAEPVGRSWPTSGRGSTSWPLPADAPRRHRLRPAGDPQLLRVVPAPAGRLGGLPDGCRSSPRPWACSRPRSRRRPSSCRSRGQPGLRQVRGGVGGHRPADRLPRRVRVVDRPVHVRDGRDRPIRPAGDPARASRTRHGARSTTTVPAERRAQVIAFNDGVPGQVGIDPVGSPAARRWTVPRRRIRCSGWVPARPSLPIVVVWAIRRRYAGSLLRALRSGGAEQVLEGGPGIAALVRDPTRGSGAARGRSRPGTRGPGDGRRRCSGASTCPARAMRSSRPLGDEDARVRAAAIRAIGRSAAGLGGLDLGPFASDPSPLVRAAALVARAGPDHRARESAARRSVAGRPGGGPQARWTTPSRTHRTALLAALDDEAAIVRRRRRRDARRIGRRRPRRHRRPDHRRPARPAGGARRARRHRGDATRRSTRRSPTGRTIDWGAQRAARRPDRHRPGRPTRSDGVRSRLPRLGAGIAAAALEDSALGALAVLGSPEAQRRHPALPALERPRDPRPGARGARLHSPTVGSPGPSSPCSRTVPRRWARVGRRRAAPHGR